MEYETILVSKADGIAKIVLNRSKAMNPINLKIAQELSLALEDVKNDPNVRAVILTGSGNAFSAGGDIREIESYHPGETVMFRDFMLTVKKTILDLRSLEKPVIGAVNGLAYGAGFSLALACDVILASEKASFCQVFVRVGLVPDMGSTYFLPRTIGTARSLAMVFSGEPVNAQDAAAMGLINKVFPPEKLEEEAYSLAKKFANGPTRAMGMAKKLIYGGLEKSLADQLDDEAHLQTVVRLTEDHKEGLLAFKEKRNPQFKGK